MSIDLYDKAVVDKVRKWTMDSNLTILAPLETKRFFTMVIDQSKEDKPLSLPLIAISRARRATIKIPAKRPVAFRGKTFVYDNDKASHLNAVPIDLTYQIDIYTRYDKEALEYVRNFVFQIINHPSVTIELPYLDCRLKQTSFMSLHTEVEDNSDIPERLISGQFTRMTLSFSFIDAYLYAYDIKDTVKVENTGIFVNPSLDGASHFPSDDCEKDGTIIVTAE